MPLAPATTAQLQAILGGKNALTGAENLIPCSFDGTAALKQMPGCVAFATTTNQVAGVRRPANQTRTPVVARGSGTGLSGGSLPVPNPVPPAG